MLSALVFAALQIKELTLIPSDLIQNESFKVSCSFQVALLISFITGIITMLKPDLTWKSTKFHQILLVSELFKFRNKVGEQSNSLPMKAVIDNYQNNIVKQEKELLGGRPMNKKYKNLLRWNVTDPNAELTCWDKVKIFFGQNENEYLLIDEHKITQSQVEEEVDLNENVQAQDEADKKHIKNSKEKIKDFIDCININMDEYENKILQKWLLNDKHQEEMDIDDQQLKRIVTSLRQQQGKIPRQEFWNIFQEMLNIVIVASITVMIFWHFTIFSAILILFSSQVMFYKDERQQYKKQQRYNKIIHDLKVQALWYESLSEIEKRIPISHEKLVNSVEAILFREVKERFNYKNKDKDKEDTSPEVKK